MRSGVPPSFNNDWPITVPWHCGQDAQHVEACVCEHKVASFLMPPSPQMG